jgi:hypothetical protein
MIDELPNKMFPASAEAVGELVRGQLCTWCDGMGWELCNMGEDAAACYRCKGVGLEPYGSRIGFSRITDEARARMKMVVGYRNDGFTLEWIGRKLKITKERVRQLQSLANRIGIK